ncbi:uncharacterized protein LOC141618962 [Silene latifolia]|uniref:uncharacterized protein LOC141618962 n=1 Tax=Silene latifolia TaxID=37657 RepID=UPI003D77754D
MGETFNAFTINARSKHLLYMLEDIRTMLMQRWVKKRMEMEASTTIVCPNIQARLEKEKEKAAYCTPLLSNVNQYQVKDGLDKVKVDLAKRTCTCRKWDATGIPCYHVVAAIFDIHALVEDYVHPMYKREAYLRSYNYSIAPRPRERHWPKVEQPMIPPPIKIGPGRPRRKRRRDPHEDPKKSGKLTKHGLEVTYSICK